MSRASLRFLRRTAALTPRSRPRLATAFAVSVAALAMSGGQALAAQGGGGGAGGAGGGGGGGCAPLTMPLNVVHSHGAYGVTIPAMVKNCSSTPDSWVLSISLAGHAPAAYTLNTGGAAQLPGDSLTTLGASFGAFAGQTYTVTGVLTETAPVHTVLANITESVTIPTTVLAA